MTARLDTSRIRAVCFDIDGTLADTDDDLVTRLAGLLRPLARLRRGLDAQALSRKLIMAAETPSNTMLTLVDSLGVDDVLAPLLHIVYWARGEARPRHYTFVPGALEALDRLRHHYRLAIVSARDRYSTHAFLNHFDLGPWFHCVATARTCRRTKPHPAPVLWAAKEMGVSPQACVMVGDTTADMRAGKGAGAQAVGVLCGFGERNELQRAGADLILESTGELAQVLLG